MTNSTIRKGHVVKVVGNRSTPSDFLGYYGIVTSENNEYKATVEIIGRIEGRGTLSYTAYPSDLEIVGEVHRPLGEQLIRTKHRYKA